MSFDEQKIFDLERPESSLLTYYALTSLLLGPFFFFLLIPLYFRWHTLRYHFDNEGVSMRWGILFRREINLTYARIQDIHLESNLVERWLGLARIKIQTASGSAKAEMTVEGLSHTDELREFLYTRMRGGRSTAATAATVATVGPASAGAPVTAIPSAPAVEGGDDLAAVLRSVADEIRALRHELAARRGQG